MSKSDQPGEVFSEDDRGYNIPQESADILREVRLWMLDLPVPTDNCTYMIMELDKVFRQLGLNPDVSH